MQERAETIAGHAVGRVVVTFEDEHPLVELPVEATVADEVEDVEGVEQRALEGGQRGAVEDDDLEQARVDEVLGRRLEQLPLPVDREGGHVARARDHHEHPERRVHDGRWGHPEGLDLTHDRGAVRQREEAPELAGVEVLPRHRLQVGGALEVEAQAHVAAGGGRRVDLGPEGRPHGSGEEGVAEALAEVLDVTHPLGHRHEAAGGHARGTDGDHEGRELGGAEGQDEGGGERLPVGAHVPRQQRGVAGVAVGDDDVEVDEALAHT